MKIITIKKPVQDEKTPDSELELVQYSIDSGEVNKIIPTWSVQTSVYKQEDGGIQTFLRDLEEAGVGYIFLFSIEAESQALSAGKQDIVYSIQWDYASRVSSLPVITREELDAHNTVFLVKGGATLSYFIQHCEDDDCGMGVFEYNCPYCGSNVQDYDIWHQQDNIVSGQPEDFSCDRCDKPLTVSWDSTDHQFLCRISRLNILPSIESQTGYPDEAKEIRSFVKLTRRVLKK